MLERIRTVLIDEYPTLNIGVEIDYRNIVTLSGECREWQEVVDVGHTVGKMKDVKSVVNDMTVKGLDIPKKDYSNYIKKGREIGVIDKADVIIIGAGITGTAIARELSKYDIKIVLVEKGEDIATGTTKANNGDIHSGYLEKAGTLKAQLNVKGNVMYDQWAKDLNFELHRNGNILVITDEMYRSQLLEMQNRATANGVETHLIGRDEAIALEPIMSESGIDPVGALHVPSMAVVDPWEVAIALGENAAINGVGFYFNCAVGEVIHEDGEVKGVVTEKGIIQGSYVINCAGMYADEISEMAGDKAYTIHPRKGTILISDKNVKPFNRPFRLITPVHQMGSKASSKGGGMATTVGGNNLIGPSATEVSDKEDLETTYKDMEYALSCNAKSDIGVHNIIRIFAGSRPATYTEDFYIKMSEITHGFINVGGIQSPGLASAPAVAEMAICIMIDDMKSLGIETKVKNDYNPYREKQLIFRTLSREGQDKLIQERPEYGRVICRCETITEGEILDVMHSPIVPTTVDGIKRRTRAGMGRCQGGFCQPLVVELLARELGKDWVEINLKGLGSQVVVAANRVLGGK